MFSRLLGRCAAIGLTLAIVSGASIDTTMAADAGPKDELGRTSWGGLGWGIGIATNFDIGGKRVGTAEVIPPANIVRIKDASSNVNVSFVLEAHYFLRDYKFAFGNRDNCMVGATYVNINCTELAHGPFVAIEVGGGSTGTPKDGLVTAFAMGWMVGLRHPGASLENKNSSWNFGLGLRVIPNSQILGDGIIANQPLPPGETVIRYKNEPRYGVTLLSSFSF